MKMIVLPVLVLSAFAGLAAGNGYSYWDPNGSGNWGDATRWKDGNVPTSGGSVVFENCDGFATDADYDLIKSLTRIRFNGPSSLDLRFEQDHDDFQSNTIMNEKAANGHGTLIKSGAGKLVHVSKANGFTPDRFVVTNGILQIDCYSDEVIYGAYGTGKLVINAAKNDFYMKGLEGDGVVTNAALTAAGKGVKIGFRGGTLEEPMVFSGTLCANFEPMFSYGCCHYFMGDYPDESTIRIYDATVGVAKVGMSGVGGSLGSTKRYWYHGHSQIQYLGTGPETTDKELCFGSTKSASFDAGAGGLTFTGQWYSRECPWVLPLHLCGTNTEAACVVQSSISGNSTNALNVVKEGPGIWRFEGERSYLGTVSVDEGTFEYDSIAERGTACAVGKSSFLSEPVWAYKTDAVEVPWAFRLGTHSTTGAFVYVGTDDAACTSRLFAVRGNGLVRSDTSASLFLKGATSYDDKGGRLILDGSGAYDNFSDVTNGMGAVSVEKTGAGTWTLGGNIDLSGVTVKAGTLRIANGPNYRWFRFTDKQHWGSDAYLQLSQFGLYDKDGNQVNMMAAENEDEVHRGKTYAIGSKSCTWDHPITYSSTRTLYKILTGLDGLMTAQRNASNAPSPSDPSTWLVFVIRLADDAAPVKYYDVKSHQGFKDGAMYNRDPRNWTLEGSVDGRNWDLLDAQKDRALTQKGCVWYSCDATKHDDTHRGFEIASAPAARTVAIGSVSVAAGATLVADAPVTVSKIVADVSGTSTIDGFAFAADGELVVDDLESPGMTLPTTFAHATGLANLANWKVVVGGQKSRGYVIAVTEDGTVRIDKRGSYIILR